MHTHKILNPEPEEGKFLAQKMSLIGSNRDMFLIHPWKVLKMFSIISWDEVCSVKILWLMRYSVVFFSLFSDHKNSSKSGQRWESILVSSLEAVHTTIFYCKWIRKENTKSLDAGHVQIQAYFYFPFGCSLSSCAHVSFLNLRHAPILPYDFWWLELLWHSFVHPCCLVQYKLPMAFLLLKMMSDWTYKMISVLGHKIWRQHLELVKWTCSLTNDS